MAYSLQTTRVRFTGERPTKGASSPTVGWVTWSVEYRGSDRYALMTREVR
jgi:hypothetical protein